MGTRTEPNRLAVTGDPLAVLKQKFALDRFLEGQRAVIERLLAGRNVAAVFPTGGGKSLCYQLPSQMFPGTTVVVSPLIALMKDQCDALAKRGIAAARLDSTLSADDFRQAIAGIRDGSIKLLYVSPERFFNERFLGMIGSIEVSLFAIDEAHCISQWGHNFRPDYLKLAELARNLKSERILALTATATPDVLGDIRDAFEIRPDDAIRTTFYRDNLHLRATVVEPSDQYSTLLQRIGERPRGATLIYVSLQKTAEVIAQQLTQDGFAASAYHAGMDAESRSQVQQTFVQSDDGIVVATIAFGMGIDKPDIRYVYHFNPPKSVESYAQEVGRAGRDGKTATCEILLAPGDRIVLENFAYGDTPSRHSVGRLLDLVVGQPESFYLSHYRTCQETDIRVLVVRTILTYLELDGYIRATSPRYETYKVRPDVSSRVILDHFEGQRREFVAGLLSCLTKTARGWFSLNMALASQRLKVDRVKIVEVVDYMGQQGWLEVRTSDLVHGYRKLTPISQPKILGDEIYDRLVARERDEIGRMDEVEEIVRGEQCQAALLSKHFGESTPEPCGHCSFCTGDGQQGIPPLESTSVGTSAIRILEQMTADYPDHFVTARDRARFLCGLSSPRFVRAKLTRHPSFGICDRIPFREVLPQVGGTRD